MKISAKTISCPVILTILLISVTQVFSAESKKKLIICYSEKEKNEFKQSIIDSVEKKYSKYCVIETRELKELKKTKNQDYDALLIIDVYKAGSLFNGKIKSYISKAEDKDRVVVFFTTGKADLKYSYKGVDAITSASVKEKVPVVEAAIFERLDKFLVPLVH